MLKTKRLAAVIMLLCTVMVAGFTTGCKTRLQEGGVYANDTFLYQAENTVNTAHDLFVEFLKWETANRQILPVSVSRAADYIRINAPNWERTMHAAHDAYVATPTPENKDKLQLALNLVRAGLQEATYYMLQNKGIAPNEGLKGIKAPDAPPVPR